MTYLPILIPVPLLLFAFIGTLAGLWRRSLAYGAALLGTAISLGVATAGLVVVLSEGNLHHFLGGWDPPWGIEYVLDPLSAFMAMLVTFIGLVVLIYSRQSLLHELPERVVPLYVLKLLLLAGLTGIAVTGDLFNLYVFLEIASLAAYALMAVGGRQSAMAAFRYVVLGTIGGTFYLLGVGFIYFSTGTLNMADAAQRLPALYESRAIMAAVAFIVLGLGLKMALFPLHVWLPDAYTYAPSAVAGLIAPIMTKVFAYALVRMFLTVFQPDYFRVTLPVTDIIGWLSAAGIVIASILAIAQRDLRRMLAYSSVAQVAYIGLGIGLANPLGMIGALLHILNHAFMKACLFLIAGGIRFRTGLVDIPLFAGFGRLMPWTMAAFTMAALSMVGIPPACGFFSKWYLVLAGLDAGNWVFVAVILISSLLNAVYFFRVLEQVYIRPLREGVAEEQVREPPAEMLAPILVLAAGIIILGIINVVIVTQVLYPVTEPLR